MSGYPLASLEKTETFRKTIPEGKKLIVPINGVEHLQELSISRAVVKSWRSHPHKYLIAKNDAITDIKKLFARAEYYGWAEDDIVVGPNGSLMQKHPSIKYWTYYRVKVYDEESYICVKNTKDGEQIPYCINDGKTWVQIVHNVKRTEPPK